MSSVAEQLRAGSHADLEAAWVAAGTPRQCRPAPWASLDLGVVSVEDSVVDSAGETEEVSEAAAALEVVIVVVTVSGVPRTAHLRRMLPEGLVTAVATEGTSPDRVVGMTRAMVAAHMMTDTAAATATTETATGAELAATWNPSGLGRMVGIANIETTTDLATRSASGHTMVAMRTPGSFADTNKAHVLWWVFYHAFSSSFPNVTSALCLQPRGRRRLVRIVKASPPSKKVKQFCCITFADAIDVGLPRSILGFPESFARYLA